MMPTPPLHHLTVTTGDLRASPRSEVADDILAMLRPIVARGTGVINGLYVQITDRAPLVYTLGWDEPDRPWVRCVMGIEDDGGVAWRHVEELAHTAGQQATTEPPRPWLAVIILPHAVAGSTTERWAMLGDAERCVAWALLEAHDAT